MQEKINEKVSVVFVYNRTDNSLMPHRMKWQSRLYTFDTLGYHHTVKQGRTLMHIFSVANRDICCRLRLDTDTLIWTLEEVSDGLAD